MKKKTLANLLESVSLKDLKSMIPFKVKMDTLQNKKQDLEKSLESVNLEIESLMGTTGKTLTRSRKKATRKSIKRSKRRIVQPSLSSVIVDLLKEKKKPLKVNEICEAVLKEKGYKTQAKNFKANVMILLYTNKKGLFKKVGPGLFGLAGEKKPTTKKKTQKSALKSVKKKSSNKKKLSATKKKIVKKVVNKGK